MKCLLVVVIALVAVVAADEEWKPETDKAVLEGYIDECFNKSGVTRKQLQNLNKEEDSYDAELLSYSICVVKKFGVFTEENGYNLERLMSQLGVIYEDVEKARDVITACINDTEKYTTPAIKALKGQQCLRISNFDRNLTERKSKV